MTKLSIIIPTVGRASLYETLSTIHENDLQPVDEVIVVADGPIPRAREIASMYQKNGLNLIYKELSERRAGVGGPARNLGISVATGTHILFMDDDDCYRAGAFLKIREEIAKNPSKILLFKMVAMAKRHIWTELWSVSNSIGLGNIGTPMFCIPRKPELLPEWEPVYIADFQFIEKAIANFGGPNEVVWVDSVIAEIY